MYRWPLNDDFKAIGPADGATYGSMYTMNRSTLWLPMVLLCLAACSESDTDAQSAAVAKPVVAAKPVKDDPTARMARAVGGGKPGAAVDIRYDILVKPEVGKPIEIKIAFIPGAGVQSLSATISGMAGITLAGSLTPQFASVEAGKAYEHTFSLLADTAGVYYVTVAVNTQFSGSSLGRTFSIPLVVGTLPTQQKTVTPPRRDASGQPIEPMRAEETRR
jgi:hypothetical protein